MINTKLMTEDNLATVDNSNSKSEQPQMNEKKSPLILRILFAVAAGFFAFISLIGRFLLAVYDIFVPRTLRELVPLLNMFRKYILTVAELFSGKKSKEVVKVASELEEIKMREEKMIKNYPIRRGMGEAINLSLHPVVMIAIPSAIFGKDLYHLFEEWHIPVSIGIMLFGTGLLVISWIATIFGPIYALFHECSLFMLRRGSYRWAEFFQDLENLFALPYYTARSSFSIFDAPPISSDTFTDFKLAILDDLTEMKNRVQDLLAMDANQVPERSKKMLMDLLKKTQQSIGSINIDEITEETARTFALLIWNKESSIFPWRRNEALKLFANRNNMSVNEARKTLQFIAMKIMEGYTSKDLYFSVMLTGALKSIAKLEQKYKQYLSDMEYNTTALSLTLGAQQYILDMFIPKSTGNKILKAIVDSIIALFLPYLVLILIIARYFKHIGEETGKAIVRMKKTKRPLATRYKEINSTLCGSIKKLGQKNNEKGKNSETNKPTKKAKDSHPFLKKLGKFFLKVILLVPLLFWSFIKTIYIRIKKLWEVQSPEKKNKRKFEKVLTTEVLYGMYQEIYDKIILSDFTYYG